MPPSAILGRDGPGALADSCPKRVRISLGVLAAVLSAFLLSLAIANENPVLAAEALFIPVSLFSMCLGLRRTGVLGWQVAVPAFYLLYFGILPLAEGALRLSEHLEDPALTPPLLLMTVGLVLFSAAGSMVPAPTRRPNSLGALSGSALGQRWFVSALALFGIWGLAYSALFGFAGFGLTMRSVSPLAGVASVAASFAPVASSIAFAVYFDTHDRRWLVTALATTLAGVAFGLYSRSKGLTLAPFLIAGVAYFNARQRLPWRLLLGVGISYIAVVYPFVMAWRSENVTEYSTRGDQLEDGLRLLRSLEWSRGESASDGFASLSRRLLPNLGDIVQRTGDSTPFEYGSTYLTGIQAMVPRFAWSEKPDLAIGNAIGKKYDWIDLSDDNTNIAPTLPGEAFLNFGVLGLFGFMALLGIFSAYMDGPVTARLGGWFLTWSTLTGALAQESLVGHSLLPMVRLLIFIFALVGGADVLLKSLHRPS